MGIVLSTLRFAGFDLFTTQDAPVDGRKHIVIIGGSYGGMSVINNLKKLLSGDVNENRPANLPSLPNLPRLTPRITLIDERDGIYHTMGTPLVHSSPDIAKTVPRAWKRYSDIPYLQDVSVVQGRVVNLDAELKEVTYSYAGEEHKMGYDYVVCSTGMQRDWPAQPRATTKEEYFKDATSFVDSLLEEKDHIVVIGGGAVGTEFAGELKLTHPSKRITLIHSRSSLLSSEPLPDELKTKALEMMEASGIEVLLNTRVKSETDGELVLSTGETITTSAVIWCTGGQRPITGYIPSAALDSATGLVRITSNLTLPESIPNHMTHFAIGDIAQWSGIKRAGGAIFMGCFTATNLLLSIVAAEGDKELKLAEFPELAPMLCLALGDQAVGHWGGRLSYGVEPLEQCFGNDLGLGICFKALNIEVDGAVVDMEKN